MSNSNYNKFVHLRNYTQYSLSKGALRIEDLVKFCVREKMPATAISDYNNLFGSLEFCLICEEFGIQPIIGTNLVVKDNKFGSGNVLLLCKNENGYKNLVKLVSTSYLDNSENQDPHITFDNLKDFSHGLICMAGGTFGILTKYFNENKKSSELLIDFFINYFKDNFFLEIQRGAHINSLAYEDFLLEQSEKKLVPIVATNENFFLSANFYKTHDALLSIAQQKYVDSEDRLKSSQDFNLKSVNEMLEIYKDIPHACENTVLIAQKCSFFLKEKPPSLPKINTNGLNEDSLLEKKSFEGLKMRIKQRNIQNLDEYEERLAHELSIIIKMGYSSYFLIVYDFINWAKLNKIPVGPGRGSGAGSLVAWCLSITNLDPINFGLIFERFLNPERVSLPDFDIDFCMEQRDEVIKYVQKKYGYLNVAQIITFGSFQARAALRDVGRVLQLPLTQIDEICKMIPYNPASPPNLNDFMSENSQVKKMIKADSNLRNLFEISLNLEGLLRHASTHAAGIVIAEKPLNEIIPLYKDPKSEIPITQFSMKYVEKIGLIKFDFLGLKTLTVIDATCKLLRKRSVNIDIDSIDLNNIETYKMLGDGLTTGVFQLEGQGMRETITKIKPDRFEDLIAIVSLYRPGPMDNIPTYINRKQNKETYSYIHNSLKEILDETYGIIVYQEQVMLIAQRLAGFSLAKADLLRRAMGKKIKSEMDAQEENFVSGCKENGLSEDKALSLFNEIAKFAGYGFNKSHAAAYAMIAYQTAFLKANYPMEFFCSLMNCDINNFDKLSVYCNEIKKMEFELVKPDVNFSEINFTVSYSDDSPTAVNFGLSAIKNIGNNSINDVILERKKNGKFKNLEDFLTRVSNNTLNKKVLEALIFSDSLKSLNINQNFLIKNLDKIISYNSDFHKNFNENQSSLFPDLNNLESELISVKKDLDLNEKLNKEIEAFGFYLSEHPTNIYRRIYPDLTPISLDDFKNNKKNKAQIYSQSFIAMVNNINERKSKSGKRYCFFNIADDSTNEDCICFSEVLDNLNFEITSGSIYVFKISKQLMNDSSRLVINSIKQINNLENNSNSYNIKLNMKLLNLKKFKEIFTDHNFGKNELYFTMIIDSQEIRIKSGKCFNVNLNLLDQIRNLSGVEDIKQIN
ncbi:MAG: DNA polymerase III subunit alpha [Alphaproteobacteria bacterium]